MHAHMTRSVLSEDSMRHSFPVTEIFPDTGGAAVRVVRGEPGRSGRREGDQEKGEKGRSQEEAMTH